MLKLEVESIEKMDEGIAKLYEPIKTDDGTVYRLKVDGVRNDEIPKLQSKIEELLGEKKSEQAKRRDLEKAAQELERARAEKEGDVEAVKESLRKHYEPTIQELQKQNEQLLSQISKLKRDDVAKEIANRNAVDSESNPVLYEYIKNRLTIEEYNGEFRVIPTEDGKPSGLKLEEWEKRLITKPELSRLVKASDAAGGGANGARQSGSAAKQRTVTRAQLAEMNPQQQMDHFKQGGTVID